MHRPALESIRSAKLNQIEIVAIEIYAKARRAFDIRRSGCRVRYFLITDDYVFRSIDRIEKLEFYALLFVFE